MSNGCGSENGRSDHPDAGRTIGMDTECLQAVFEKLQAGIVLIDEEKHIIVDANAKAAEMIGCAREDIVGKVCHEFICTAERGKCPISDLGQNVDNARKVLLTSSGRHVPILKTVSRISINGRPHILDSFVDISEQSAIMEALEDSEARFRAITSSARDAIIKIDNDGNVILWNPSAADMFGYSVEEVFGRNLHDLIAPERYHEAHRRGFRAFRDSGQGDAIGKTLELIARHRDGHEFPVELSLSSVIIKGQWHAIAIVRNVSERREAEIRFRSIFEGSRDGIMLADPVTQTFIMANPAIERLLGYTQEELMSMGLGDIHPPEDLPMVASVFRRQAEGEIELAEDLPVVRKDGKKIYCDINSTIQRIDNRDLLMGVFRDVSEKKRMHDALKHEKEKAENYLRLAGVMFIALDTEGRITLVNPRGCEVLCGTESELLGRDWFGTFVPAAKRDDVRSVFQRIMAGDIQAVENYENPVITLSGRERNIAWHNSVLRDDDGNVIGLLSSGEDVTDIRDTENALRDSERKFRLLSENSSDVIWSIDLGGKFQYVSPSVLKLRGFTAEEVMTQNIGEVLTPDGIKLFESEMVRIIEALGNAESIELNRIFELEQPCKGGSTVWTEVAASMMFNDRGEPIGIQGISRNIAERKRTERLLQESERKYRLLVDTANEAIVVAQDGMLRFVNRMTLELLDGYTEQEIMATPFTTFIHPEDREMVVDNYKRRMNGGDAPERYTFRMNTRASEAKWVEINAVMIDWEGRPATLNFLSDITDQKNASERLRKSELHLRTLIESMEEGVMVIGTDYRIQNANRAISERFGLTKEQMIGKHCYEISHQRSSLCEPPGDPCPFLQVLETGKPSKVIHTHHAASGEATFVELNASPLRDGEGAVTGIIEVSRDITERKMMEDALKVNIDELERYKKATIDREHRMIGMKEELRRIKEGRAPIGTA